MKTQLIEGDQDGTLIPQDAFSGAQPVEVVDANLVRLAEEVLPALRSRIV